MTNVLGQLEPGRREVKYVADESMAWHIDGWLKAHHAAFVPPYPARWINNIYFDSPDYTAYAENLAGVSSRAKVRYRWYGDLQPIAAGQLEVKLRRSGLGWKQIHPVPTPPTEGQWRDLIRHFAETGGAEVRPWLDAFSQPVLINRYRRCYWVTPNGHVRVTIDTNHSVFDQRYQASPTTSHAANITRTTVLEVKYLPEHHDEVKDTIASLPISLSRHSKFAVGVDAIRSF